MLHKYSLSSFCRSIIYNRSRVGKLIERHQLATISPRILTAALERSLDFRPSRYRPLGRQQVEVIDVDDRDDYACHHQAPASDSEDDEAMASLVAMEQVLETELLVGW